MATDYTYLYEEYPEVISADQLYRICHISKRKAKWLLEHGYIPCEDSGKKTRRYKIRLNDVISSHLKLHRIWLRHPWEHSMSSASNSIRSLRYAKRGFNGSSTIYGQMKWTSYESQMCRYCWGIALERLGNGYCEKSFVAQGFPVAYK